jgi:RsiW-degrading membrane proteinase PrsW (M82 family)
MNNEKKPLSPLAESSDKEKEKINLSSRKKWFWLGIVVALIAPIAGVVLAVAFWTESELKKEGKIILIFAIIWGVIFLYLSNWLVEQGYLPVY